MKTDNKTLWLCIGIILFCLFGYFVYSSIYGTQDTRAERIGTEQRSKTKIGAIDTVKGDSE